MIGNISKSKGFKGDPGKNFTYEDFTPEQLADLRDGVIGVLDPDGIFEKIESIPVEPGGVNEKTGVPEERDDAIRSIGYLEVTPEKTMFFTSSLPIGDDGSVHVCIYDGNYTFVETVHVALETDFTVESIVSTESLESLGITASALKYLKFYRSDTNDATVEMHLVTRAIKPEFKKIYFADHGYAMYGSEMDNETMHKLVVEALGKDGNEYNIFEIKAPKNAPGEASLALMNKGDGTLQFVDFSSLTYDKNNPTVEVVCQTRGDHKLPKFSIRYNDGKGAGRVMKFTVNPDCIPVELTSEGIKVRRNNNYDNNATEKELVTVNLADMYDAVNMLLTKVADYNQNNPNKPDYIKNRPFYDSTEIVCDLKNVLPGETQKRAYENYVPQIGDTLVFVVEGDGETSSKEVTISEFSTLINTKLGICKLYSDGFSITTTEGGGISIRITKKGELKRLDEKFIPDTIARKSDVEALIGTANAELESILAGGVD